MNEFLSNLRQSWQEAAAPLYQRWAQLQPREQLALAVAAAVALVLLLVYGLWFPSHNFALKAQKRFEANRVLLQELQSQTAGAPAAGAAGGSLLRLASDSAGAINLSLSRIEPEGEGGVRVWVEKADFNVVAAWLATLSAQGVQLREAQVEKQSGGGVSARLALSR